MIITTNNSSDSTGENVLTSFGGSALISIGIEGATKGALQISEGALKNGAKKLLLGMHITSLGAILLDLQPGAYQDLAKLTLLGSVLAVGLEGICNFAESIKQYSAFQSLKGGMQLSMAAISANYVSGLSSKTIFIIQQSTVTISVCVLLAYSGFQDKVKGSCIKGAIKTAFSAIGILSSCYYAYREI